VPAEGITVSGIADAAGVRKQTMAQAVDQLERTGYVERRPNPTDRRSRLVFLTERGASVPPVTHAAAARVEEHWSELASPQELDRLRASLLRLLTELRARG
jgi:DNA-binding MarR family transcriptional regulator